MAILKEKDIQNLLERHLTMALGLVGKTKKQYSVKRMGRVNRYPTMSAGYYIQIQNFDDLSTIKKSQDESFFRYTFRCIQFKKQSELIFEISKWTPLKGSVDNDYKVYTTDDKQADGKFLERLVTIINMVEFQLSPVPPPTK